MDGLSGSPRAADVVSHSPQTSPKTQKKTLEEQIEQVFISTVPPKQETEESVSIKLGSLSPSSTKKPIISTEEAIKAGVPIWAVPLLSTRQPLAEATLSIPEDVSGLTDWSKDVVRESHLYSGDSPLFHQTDSDTEEERLLENHMSTQRFEKLFDIASFDNFNEWPFVATEDSLSNPRTDVEADTEHEEADLSSMSPISSPRQTQTEPEPFPPTTRVVTNQSLPPWFCGCLKSSSCFQKKQTNDSAAAPIIR